MEEKVEAARRQAGADTTDQVRKVQHELDDARAAHAEELESWQRRESELLDALKQTELNAVAAIENAVKEVEQHAAHRQLLMDEQHQLEIGRLKQMHDQHGHEQAEQERLVKQDFSTLTQLHAKDLQVQHEQHEQSAARLRQELVQKACSVEQLQLEVQSIRSQLQTDTMRLQMNRDNDVAAEEEKLLELKAEHRRVGAAKTAEFQAETETALATQEDRARVMMREMEANHSALIAEHENVIQKLSTEIVQLKHIIDDTIAGRGAEARKAQQGHRAEIAAVRDSCTADRRVSFA